MFEFYMKYVLCFGEILTEMEKVGIKVDTTVHLKNAELRAREERKEMENIFMSWAERYCSTPNDLNIARLAFH
jgi:DNA polymerase-1